MRRCFIACWIGCFVGLVLRGFIGEVIYHHPDIEERYLPASLKAAIIGFLPAFNLAMALFAWTRFARVLRPNAMGYALLLGAMTGGLLDVLYLQPVARFLDEIIGQSGDFLRWNSFALLPAALAVFLTTRRQEQSGLCLKCGYDLRASKERCPECGTAVPVDLVRGPMR